MWRIFHEVVAAGTTYVFAPDTSREDALAYFVGQLSPADLAAAIEAAKKTS